MTGVLEEAKFFGISSILEQLEEMVKVLFFVVVVCFTAKKMNPSQSWKSAQTNRYNGRFPFNQKFWFSFPKIFYLE